MSRETERHAGAKSAIVCYVTDRKSIGASDPIAGLGTPISHAISAGVDWVQIREKDLPARELLALAKAAVIAASENNAPGRPPARIIVNDRLDVALAAGAAGVHLGRESLSAGEVIRWCRSGNAPADFLVGVSCHTLEEVRAAEAAGANYAIFGPVFDTPSKRPFGPPQGIAKLAAAYKAVRIPVIAIGGVDRQNAAECLRVGAAGIAAIRLFQNAEVARSLVDFVSELREVQSHA